jgi:hypothetical protein
LRPLRCNSTTKGDAPMAAQAIPGISIREQQLEDALWDMFQAAQKATDSHSFNQSVKDTVRRHSDLFAELYTAHHGRKHAMHSSAFSRFESDPIEESAWGQPVGCNHKQPCTGKEVAPLACRCDMTRIRVQAFDMCLACQSAYKDYLRRMERQHIEPWAWGQWWRNTHRNLPVGKKVPFSCHCWATTNIAEIVEYGTGGPDDNGFWERPCTHGKGITDPETLDAQRKHGLYVKLVETDGRFATVQQFREEVATGRLLDSDGFAKAAKYVGGDLHVIETKILPSQAAKKLPEDATHVLWYPAN